MPKKKPSTVSRTQPSLDSVPPPTMQIRRKGARAASDVKPDGKGSDLFIVDNSAVEWKVARYLRDWCEVAKAFDIATGYFEIGSLLALNDQWQQLESIRILMGDEVSLRTHQAFERAFERIQAVLDISLEDEKEKNDFLKGVPAIVAALESGQIQCRVYADRKFHAKAYITHTKFEIMPPVALVGSSNFTYPGLHDNVELNIQIRHDVDELQDWYERHWDEAKEVTPDLLRVIARHTREYSPFQVYAKSLYEFFKGHALTASEWELTQSNVYPILDQYQREGYQALLKIGGKYNGALLCDGVGLGKTFVGLMLIERLIEHERLRVALIVPKAARKPVWESKLKKHLPGIGAGGAYSNLAIYNHTDLLRGGDYLERMAEIQDKADVVIIDEAHHFRNQAAKRYRKLFEMLDGKQVYLLTATPVNNSLLDLQHLIELFSRRQANYFGTAPLGIHSLPGHFKKLENALDSLTGSTLATDISLADAEKVLADDPLARELVIQRSRAYVRKSQEQQGVSQALFPKREPPKVGKYSLQKTYGVLLEKLRQAFFRGPNKPPLLSLAIYNPVAYPTAQTTVDDFVRGRQGQIVSLIRTQLLKRFESSAIAFQSTCERLLLKLLAFVTANSDSKAEKSRLSRWQAQHNDFLTRVSSHHRMSAEDDDEDEEVLPPEFLEAAEVLSRAEYKVDEILDETYLDLDQLIIFLNELEDFSPQTDDKLQSLLSLLETDPNLKSRKVLIFSEYKETAHYVYEQLKASGIGPIDEVHSGVARERGEVIKAFSPFYNDSSSRELVANGVTETRVLIATDVLAEGLNLQDANLLINYDLHWNPVRLMQRIGRIDRRMDPEVEVRLLAEHPNLQGTREVVRYWNFLPPNELDNLLALYQKVAQKTLRISKVFGIEGQQLLRPEDDYAALREFNQAYEGTPSTLENMRLAYQALLKDHPNLETELPLYPLRVFSGRTHPTAGVRALFLCYNRPAKNASTGIWDIENGDTQWYLYDLVSDKIIEDVEQIDAVIRSTPDTPRQCVLDEGLLRETRLKVEKHIMNSYLKPSQAPIGAKPALRAWLELG